MELINDTFLDMTLRLEANMAGWQALFLDNTIVSQRAAAPENSADDTIVHRFEVLTSQGHKTCELHLTLAWQPFTLNYWLMCDNQEVLRGQRSASDLHQSTPQQMLPIKQRIGIAGLASLGFKLLKSAKVFKTLLVVGSLAAYSWLFSFQFALALLACLVFHEYGHLRAMKYFGFPTRGMYLIPFVGGLAVMDSRVNTRWQAVVIAIMGPTFGLLISIGGLVLYYLTGEVYFAALASFNALLNLFNLLPVLPLDGGRLLQAITFSMNSWVGLIVCIAGALLGVLISYTLGLALLGLLLLIGSVEIFAEWRHRKQSLLLPLTRYGQAFSTVWYVLTVTVYVGIIIIIANSGDQLLGLPLEILSS